MVRAAVPDVFLLSSSSPDRPKESLLDTRVTPHLLGWGTSMAAVGLGDASDANHDAEKGESKDATRKVVVSETVAIKQIATSKHTLFLTDSGAVYSCGANNDFSQVAREGKIEVPRRIELLETFIVSAVACGDDFSVIVTQAGKVFSWGKNTSGQLGHGNRDNLARPRMVKGLLSSKKVLQVCAGRSHTLLLCRTGEIFGCGDHRIGNGSTTGSLLPSALSNLYGA